MFNPRLTETLTDFPFARLNALLGPIAPPAHLSLINMSVGEPQGAMPSFARQIVADEIEGWNKYPPNQGLPDLNLAICEWLTRRYKLPQGLLDPARHVHPTAGSKEGVYIISTVATPHQKGGDKPVVALPNPFYQAYLGGAVLSGAEPLLVNANASNGFLPDYEGLDEATWRRLSVVYLCSPANPQGAIAGMDYLQKLIRLCRKHDAVLAVDECYAEIYTGDAPVGALQAALAMDETGGEDPFRNLAVFHSLSKRSNAAGLRSGFVAGDPGLVAMVLRWRTYGGPQIPFAVQKASAALWREETHPIETREWYRRNFRVAEQILHNRFGYFTPGGGFFLWLDVGDGEAATRRLWGEAHVKVLPGAYVCRETDGINAARRYIRVALVHDEKTTREGLGRLASVL
ncbi:aminotransferase class I/II-fold pyridoxal phosphate-dependent enzyme [Reyranella sp.]|jgi:aspartate/methionine/tyrosine aminotransferase|uniref:aminotransferase class I/II-fold pyridoxal phosphate-dependent enzyme n=1 Tax=Reyranella sp. TaxID=1929291 RepID=UPI002F9499FD